MERKEAIEVLRKYSPKDAELREALETAVPELKESEDEKIIRTLKEIVNWGCAKNISVENNVELKDCLAWLEKQGEQNQDVTLQINPSEYINDMGGNGCYLKNTTQASARTEEDEKHKNTIIRAIHGAGNITPIEGELAEKWLKSLKSRVQPQPKQEWSEEDSDYFDAIIAKLEVTQDDALLTDNQMDFLKTLKERYTWKPSDLPHWEKSTLPDAEVVTGFNSDYFYHKGYIINYKELFEKLPKDD